jgi:RecA-family ATPase
MPEVKAGRTSSRRILVSDLDAAVEFVKRIAAIQVRGYFLLRLMKPTENGIKPYATYWFDNREPEFLVKVRRCLQRCSNKHLHVFYAINSFREREANAANVAQCRFAQVDADRVQLPPPGPTPSIIVETSPGNHQFLYVFDRPVDPEIAQQLSQALTRHIGGDPGGHSPVKLFRLPGTWNYKPEYASDYPRVRRVSDTGEVHSIQELQTDLRMSLRASPAQRAPAIQADGVDIPRTIGRLIPRLSREAKFRLQQRNVWPAFSVRFGQKITTIPREDCSEACFRFGLDLRKAGASPAEIKALIPQTAVWKDRERRGKREYLDVLVDKITAQPVLNAIDPADFEYQPLPTRDWLCPDLFPMRKVTALYGDGAVGKTLLAIQLAVAVAMQLPFLGREVRQGRVYALLAEDENNDLHMTLEAILKREGISYRALRGRMRVLPRAGLDSVLMSFVHGQRATTDLFRTLLDDIRRFGPTLVIVDTAADVFDGNENDRSQVRRFLNEICVRIAIETSAAVLLCAHPSIAGKREGHGFAGSTAWNNTVRSRLYLQRDLDDNNQEPDPDVRILELKKANFAQHGQELRLRWEHGVFALDKATTSPDGTMLQNESRTLAAVKRAFNDQNPFSKHAQSGDRYLVTWMVRELKLTYKKAKAFMTDLLHTGKIRQVEYATRRFGLCSAEQATSIQAKRASRGRV